MTANRDVQQRRLASGVKVMAHFGDQPYRLDEETLIGAMGLHVDGM